MRQKSSTLFQQSISPVDIHFDIWDKVCRPVFDLCSRWAVTPFWFCWFGGTLYKGFQTCFIIVNHNYIIWSMWQHSNQIWMKIQGNISLIYQTDFIFALIFRHFISKFTKDETCIKQILLKIQGNIFIAKSWIWTCKQLYIYMSNNNPTFGGRVKPLYRGRGDAKVIKSSKTKTVYENLIWIRF